MLVEWSHDLGPSEVDLQDIGCCRVPLGPYPRPLRPSLGVSGLWRPLSHLIPKLGFMSGFMLLAKPLYCSVLMVVKMYLYHCWLGLGQVPQATNTSWILKRQRSVYRCHSLTWLSCIWKEDEELNPLNTTEHDCYAQKMKKREHHILKHWVCFKPILASPPSRGRQPSGAFRA